MTIRERETSITQKGQVTIPVEIRTRLGLKPRDRVVFDMDDNVVTLRPLASKVLRGYGAVSAKRKRERSSRDEFERGVAQEVTEETKQPRAAALR